MSSHICGIKTSCSKPAGEYWEYGFVSELTDGWGASGLNPDSREYAEVYAKMRDDIEASLRYYQRHANLAYFALTLENLERYSWAPSRQILAKRKVTP